MGVPGCAQRTPGGGADDREQDGLTNPTPHMARLARILGRWKTTGGTRPEQGEPCERIEGCDHYALMPGGAFIEHRVDGRVGDVEVKGVEIIGWDAERGAYRTWWFGMGGDRAEFELTFDRHHWRLRGERERFEGRFEHDGETLSGVWERREDGGDWTPWMDVRLRRED